MKEKLSIIPIYPALSINTFAKSLEDSMKDLDLKAVIV